jgi:hypothetical protein
MLTPPYNLVNPRTEMALAHVNSACIVMV